MTRISWPAAAFGAAILAVIPAPVGAFEMQPPEPVDLAAVAVIDADGQPVTLAERLPDAPAIVHFWATWCLPCRAELPQIDAYRADLAAAGLADRLALVSVDRVSHDAAQRFLADELDLPGLPTLQDVNGTSGTMFRILGFPTTVLLDADHAIVGRQRGTVAWGAPATRDILARHLSGATP